MSQCKHEFIGVYYGDWEVECKHCSENIFNVLNEQQANQIINEIILKKPIQ